MPLSIVSKTRTLFWLTKALVKRYHPFLVFGFITGFILFLGAIFTYSFFATSLEKTQTKRIGIIGNYTPTDFPLKIQRLLSFGLTDLTPQGEATGAAVLDWEVKDEGKVYLFHLKRDLSWQDGNKFQAADINYNLKDAEISTLDDYTLQIKLKEPFSPLPVLLAQPLFRPGLVGLGRYKVDLLGIKDDHLVNLTLAPVGSEDLLPIQYKFYPSQDQAIMAYKLGEIDVIEGLSTPNAFINWPVKVEAQKMSDRYVGLFYNTEDSVLGQKQVRQALTHALSDLPDGERPSSPLNRSSWAYNNGAKKYETDLALAQKIFKQSEVATKSGEKKLTIATTEEYEDLARQIAKSWENLNIGVEVKVEKEVPTDFQVLLAVQEIPVDPDQYSLWHSTQRKTNITRYKNPRIDKLLEDGRKIVDSQERKKKYFDFQKYLADDIPAAFLYHPLTYTVSRR